MKKPETSETVHVRLSQAIMSRLRVRAALERRTIVNLISFLLEKQLAAKDSK